MVPLGAEAMFTAGHVALASFAAELAELRMLAGSPSLNELVAASAEGPDRLARSTVSDKLTAKSLPDWSFVTAYVGACARHAASVGIALDDDQVDLARWDAAHWRMLAALDTARAADRLAAAARTEIARRRRPGPVGPSEPPQSGAARAPVVPRQLPHAAVHFAGRGDQLAALDSLLRRDDDGVHGVVIAAITGTAGVGKTTLAVHWAHQVAGRFPDGQLYVNLRGFDADESMVAPAGALRGFLAALGVPPSDVSGDPDALSALYRSQLAGRRVLILLDNARDADHVRLLLPGESGCLVVVTSRNQLSSLVTVEGAQPLPLDLPSQLEARQMLIRRLGLQRVAAEPPAVEQIIARTARLPLALAIVAARAAVRPEFPLSALAGQLEASRTRLDALAGGDALSDVRAVFSWSYTTLSSGAAWLFRLLGLHPGPDLSTGAAAGLAGLSGHRTQRLLDELAAVHLIIEHAPGRYAFHDLLRTYATEQAKAVDSDDERDAATRRMLDHYLHTAHRAAMLLDPHREPVVLAPTQSAANPQDPADYQQALAWFGAEYQILLAAVRHAAGLGLDSAVWQLAWTLVDFLDRRGHWHEHVASGELAVVAAQRLGEPAVLARAHRLLARGLALLGRFDETDTHLRHALDLHASMSDPVGQAHTHLNIAFVREQQHRHHDALRHAAAALTLYRGAGHEAGQASALSALATYHALLGSYHEALVRGELALELHQRLGYTYGQAAAWDSLGNAHRNLGHHAQAVLCYQHTLDLVRELGDRFNEASTLVHIGDIHHGNGQQDAAHTAWRQAVVILDELRHPTADEVRTKLTAAASSRRPG